MRISRIHIKNYRSLRNIDIYPKGLCALVGENNAGKSNILRALNLVLGEAYPSARSLDKTDFFNNDICNSILIEVYFEDNEENVEKIFLKVGIDEETEALKVELKMKYRGSPDEYYVKKDIKEKYGIIHIKAIRDLERHLGQSSWTLLGKISRLLNEEFSNVSDESTRIEIDRLYQSIKEKLSIKKFKLLEKELKEALSSQLLRTEHDIKLDFQPFDPLDYYKTLQLIPKELGEIKEISQLGDGTKNMILLALFRAYAKTFPGTSIIAIEEPEIYLHPQSCKSLYTLFRELEDKGTQIILTTHHPEFVDLEYFDEICVVRKSKDKDGLYSTSVTQVDINSFVEKRRRETGIHAITSESIRQFLRNISNSEANKSFFSRFIVIVEGNTEKFALPIYAKKLGFDFDKRSVEVVGVNGKNQIDTFISLYEEFDFSYYVIWDGDKDKQKDVEANRRITRRLKGEEIDWPETEIAEKFAVFENNWEDEFSKNLPGYDTLVEEAMKIYGLKKDRNKEIVAKYIANKLAKEEIPDFIVDIVSKIEALWEGYENGKARDI